MNHRQKFWTIIALFGVWGGFALAGKTPIPDFITAVRDALIALGIFHAAMSDPKNPSDPPNIGPKQ